MTSPLRLLQQPSVWYQWILSVSATNVARLIVARNVSLWRKYDHITPVFENLYTGYQLSFRINYKILFAGLQGSKIAWPPPYLLLFALQNLGGLYDLRVKHLLTNTSLSPGRFLAKALFLRMPTPSLWKQAPYLHQVCPVHWHFSGAVWRHICFNVAY